MFDLKFSDTMLILATILGPILAVQAQKFLERITQSRRRRLDVFYTLVATRGTRLAPAHVEALNRIDLEFSGATSLGLIMWQKRKEAAVIARWREYSARV